MLSHTISPFLFTWPVVYFARSFFVFGKEKGHITLQKESPKRKPQWRQISNQNLRKKILFKSFNESKQKTYFLTISFKSHLLAIPVMETLEIKLIVAAFTMIAQNDHLHCNTR